MADPLARWRNPKFRTVRELVDLLPRIEQDKQTARDIINERFGQDFFRTAYQVACQLGLYYETEDRFIPRFRHDPSADELYAYLRNWIKMYYIPNPCTRRGFDNLSPRSIHSHFCQLLIEAEAPVSADEAHLSAFGGEIGNSDILNNTLEMYSDVIHFDRDGLLNCKEGVRFNDLESYVYPITEVNAEDKVLFFRTLDFDLANQHLIQTDGSLIANSVPRNKIIYGAPGTGKSYELRDQATTTGFNPDNIIRVTFHPNYSYQQFIGAYKPTPIYRNVLEDGAVLYGSDKTTELEANFKKEPLIDYTFIPGPFLTLLVKSLKNSGQNYLMIIEEINRASVSSVFGDVFQLLDRNEVGTSEYSISFNEEAKSFLRSNGIYNTEIKIPNNFFIWATMNSADQGVMPLDAAFKRRWTFEYLPLDKMQGVVSDREITFQQRTLNWNYFRSKLNDTLKNIGIVEDKLIGPFFMNSNELADSSAIKNKLLLYLRDDVVRHNPESLFRKKTYSDIITQYENNEEIFIGVDFSEEAETA